VCSSGWVFVIFIGVGVPGRIELHASDWDARRLREDAGVAQPPRVVFLPGAIGAGEFWRGAGEALPGAWEKVYLSWPGLGDEPRDRGVRGFDDLVELVIGALERQSDLVAQSIGGLVAVRVATRAPGLVRRLVLVATSGGVDTQRLGAADWRPEYREAFPNAAAWVTDPHADQTEQLRGIESPTLLVWGDADPISPVVVGEHLAGLIPRSTLRVIRGGTHDLARETPGPVARLIADHLASRSLS
jgi:pimeloyl-ACP methyl ester carboxylesterase